MHRLSSLQAASISCNGTWQRDFNLPFPLTAKLERRVVEHLCAIQRMFYRTVIREQYRRGGDDLLVDPVTIHLTAAEPPDPSTRNKYGGRIGLPP